MSVVSCRLSVIILCSPTPSSPSSPPSPPLPPLGYSVVIGCVWQQFAICDRHHLHYTTITCQVVTLLNV
ncbi:hypothetical protein [Anabaena azotica]|uniref:Secreted protein n=1 Tax=Anabaena azotica FACHB-119 TaxID=947527 RepID=A0ABR8D0I2_9NOST|nr:hypothetical protein [Anabaena azotica]MBD2499903.1 hypothetical protein [Anabaena azotica FACHB-119]